MTLSSCGAIDNYIASAREEGRKTADSYLFHTKKAVCSVTLGALLRDMSDEEIMELLPQARPHCTDRPGLTGL